MWNANDAEIALAEYLKSQDGKEFMKKNGYPDFNVGISGRRKNRDTKYMIRVAQDFTDILYEHIVRVIPSFDKNGIIITPPYNDGDQMVIDVSFSEAATHRESLDPERYPDGIKDIVQLFAHGYSARGSVYGKWLTHGGKETWSLRSREPNPFLEEAVKEFNRRYKNNAYVELDETYTK